MQKTLQIARFRAGILQNAGYGTIPWGSMGVGYGTGDGSNIYIYVYIYIMYYVYINYVSKNL